MKPLATLASAAIRGTLRALLVTLVVLIVARHHAGAAPSSSTIVEFSGFPGGSAIDWLKKKGFSPQQDATNPGKVRFDIAANRLVLEAKQKALALMLAESNRFGYSRIRIEWGVDEFPSGASYEKGVRAESVIVYVFFGDRKLSSGSLLVPNSPYFIGLFLCESDPVGRPYQGRHFKAGGRYVCADRTTTGESVVTEFAIDEAFKRYFGLSETPYISGLGIGIDTSASKGKGTGRAYVARIEFLK